MGKNDWLIVVAYTGEAGLTLATNTKISITATTPTSGGGDALQLGGESQLGGKIINVKPSPLPRIPQNKSLTITGRKYKKSRRSKAKGVRKATARR